MPFLTVKNWREFQHYNNRRPPWIRLHRSLLDDFDFQCLPVASRALAPMLWLLASEYVNGKIDAEPSKLAFRLRMSPDELTSALKPLIAGGFFSSDSAVLAECLHVAVPETETETETETEKKKIPAAKKPAAGPSRKTTFTAWIESLPDGQDAIPETHHVFAYADRVKIPRAFLDLAWIAFERRYSRDPKRYTDWPAVFRKAVEANWYHLWFMRPDGSYELTTAGRQLELDAERTPK